MPMEDDDRPRKKITHEIGQDLSLLSVEELNERIALLASEIARLQEACIEGCSELGFQNLTPSSLLSAFARRATADKPHGRPVERSCAHAGPMADMANKA
jgi:uncharacterized small protein (DUF1192 family)